MHVIRSCICPNERLLSIVLTQIEICKPFKPSYFGWYRASKTDIGYDKKDDPPGDVNGELKEPQKQETMTNARKKANEHDQRECTEAYLTRGVPDFSGWQSRLEESRSNHFHL